MMRLSIHQPNQSCQRQSSSFQLLSCVWVGIVLSGKEDDRRKVKSYRHTIDTQENAVGFLSKIQGNPSYPPNHLGISPLISCDSSVFPSSSSLSTWVIISVFPRVLRNASGERRWDFSSHVFFISLHLELSVFPLHSMPEFFHFPSCPPSSFEVDKIAS